MILRPPLSHRLYLFYNGLSSKGLKFRTFVSQYATLNHCDEKTLSDIIYFLCGCSIIEETHLTRQEYELFVRSENNIFSFPPATLDSDYITKEDFYNRLLEAGFLWQVLVA